MQPVLGIAVYTKKDYAEIYEISDDQSTMNDTWEDWKIKKEEKVQSLRNMGINAVDVSVKPKELVDYCRSNGIGVSGKSRADFVAYKLSSTHK